VRQSAYPAHCDALVIPEIESCISQPTHFFKHAGIVGMGIADEEVVRFEVLIDVRIVESDDQANGFLLVVPHQGISDLPITPGWCDASLLYAADDLRMATSLFILLHRARIRHIFYLLI
jgi:hypothetical protein